MSHCDFPRQVRLLNAEDYRGVFNDVTCRVSNKHILMLATHNQGSGARLGLIFSKKNVRLAVQRNRLKRLVRESFRQHRENLDSLDIVVLARNGISELDNEIVTQQLEKLWRKLNQRAKKPIQNRT